ncbi:MAG: DMT family transporter [Ktedonobacteraceae bacterium]|nr:DMT family transporter [Ktedonobacteraceae bacterium]
MGIILGLTAALGWGTADFLVRYATRFIGTYRTLFYMQFVGFVALSAYLLFSGELGRLLAKASWQPWALALLVGVLSMLGSLALYRAFEVGVLSIVSPVAASYAALTVVLALLSGERISQARGLGIIAALIGIALAATSFTPASTSPEETKTRRHSLIGSGVGWALTASVMYGVDFWILGFHVAPELGGIAPVWFIRLTTICTVPLVTLPMRQSLRPPTGKIWWLIMAIGLIDTVGFTALTLGVTTDQVSLISVLSSLFSAVTVLLAWLFLHEKLHWIQWLGVGIIFIGIALVKV